MKFNHKVSPTYTSNIFSTNLNPKPLRTPKTTNTFNSQILNHASPKTQERELFQNRKRVMSQTTNQIKEALTNNYYSVEERSIEEEEEDYCE